jgi:hypothetical protein
LAGGSHAGRLRRLPLASKSEIQGFIFFPDGTQLPLREPKTRGAGRHLSAAQNPGNSWQAPGAERGQKRDLLRCLLFRPGSQDINVATCSRTDQRHCTPFSAFAPALRGFSPPGTARTPAPMSAHAIAAKTAHAMAAKTACFSCNESMRLKTQNPTGRQAARGRPKPGERGAGRHPRPFSYW